jgi:hypothetical protein
VHSWRTAPIRCSASISISSCITIRTDAQLRSTPSPGGLAHLRGDWVGKEIGALNPFGGMTPARSRAAGESTTQLAAEAVVRAARALKRWAAIDVEKQTECHGGRTFAPRHSGGPARLESKKLLPTERPALAPRATLRFPWRPPSPGAREPPPDRSAWSCLRGHVPRQCPGAGAA